MWPVLVSFGPFTLHTYGLLVGLGFLAGQGWFVWESRRRGWPPSFCDRLFVLILASGLVGSRLLYVLIEWSYFFQHPTEIFKIWAGGLIFYGGLFLAVLSLVFYLWRVGQAFSPVADALSPGLALGQAIGRWGCFAAGCCYGLPTQVPWAVRFTHPMSLAPLGVKLHPTQIYESFSDLLIFCVLAIKNRKTGREGSTAALYLVLYGISRFLLEFLRGDDRGGSWAGLSPGQCLSILGVGCGMVWWIVLRNNAKAA